MLNPIFWMELVLNMLNKFCWHYRDLTEDEISLAKLVYKNSIDYSQVRIFSRGLLPVQDLNTIVTPNGWIYAPKNVYSKNYSQDRASRRKLFIHEMGHVWQHQSGVNLYIQATALHTSAFLRKQNPYSYDIHLKKIYNNRLSGQKLLDYNLEAQAEIFADFWVLKYAKDVSLIDMNNRGNLKGDLQDLLNLYQQKIDQVIEM